ncbi:MAG TPA: tripartite tricarboxylate transporter substrate binding protein [Ramlibacter sp.]|nr:tripartite tricarboxylate transporter substrate binding protein [Ramlibacter sp.]
MDRRRFNQAALAAAALCSTPALHAQAKFPSKPIRFVVPFAAGGGGDTIARLMAQRLTERVGQAVVVENRVGAGGNIGADYVLKSPPDGYTLLNMSSTYPIQAAVSNPPFDAVSDLQPIMLISRDALVLVVHPNAPFRTARDLQDAAKKSPDKFTHGSAGIGSIAHLGMEELAFVMGAKMVHVPYKGSSQAFNDLLAGSVDLVLTSVTFAAPFIRSGKVRALGISGTQRLAGLPDVPTFEEQGIRGYNVVDWKAIGGPKGIPADVVAYLNTELNAALQHPAVQEKFRSEGTTALGGTPDQMMQAVREDIARWKKVVQMANIKIQ